MTRIQSFKLHPVALSAMAAIYLIGVPLAAPAAPAQETGAKACRSDAEEAELLKKEKVTIGGRHALDHARSRIAKCEVEKGQRKVPAKDIVRTPEESLQEDKNAREAVHKVIKAEEEKEKAKNAKPKSAALAPAFAPVMLRALATESAATQGLTDWANIETDGESFMMRPATMRHGTPRMMQVQATQPAAGPTDWVNMANEGGTFTLRAPITVRYGALNNWYAQTISGVVNCNNDVFGDPIWGVAKSCQVSAAVLVAAPPGSSQPAELRMGRWSSPFTIPITGMSAVLLHTGKVMFWSYDPNNNHQAVNSANGVNYLWNPTNRQGYFIAPPPNLWCSGQTILADGRVLAAGGNLSYPVGADTWKGAQSAYTFNPITEKWTTQGSMALGRWYPSLTKMVDNRVVVTSGYDDTGSGRINAVVDVFTPSADMNGVGSFTASGYHESSGLFPLQYLLPSGQMLEAGPDRYSSFQFNHATNNWSQVPPLVNYHFGYGSGISYSDASVTPARQVVMVAGGLDAAGGVAKNEWIDGMNPMNGWKPYPQWNVGRYNSNTVMLPDGAMLTLGGAAGPNGGYDNPVLSSELYSAPADNTGGVWKTVARHDVQAAYHSSALLLPDATVMLMQDDMDTTTTAAMEHKAQIYAPPYLFKGPQPVITAAPETLRLGNVFTISTDRDGMSGAVLVAPSATTHANDMHQRVIKLKTEARTNGLSATVPTSAGMVPPGYYMLFVLDSKGIPSTAKFVRIS